MSQQKRRAHRQCARSVLSPSLLCLRAADSRNHLWRTKAGGTRVESSHQMLKIRRPWMHATWSRGNHAVHPHERHPGKGFFTAGSVSAPFLDLSTFGVRTRDGAAPAWFTSSQVQISELPLAPSVCFITLPVPAKSLSSCQLPFCPGSLRALSVGLITKVNADASMLYT